MKYFITFLILLLRQKRDSFDISGIQFIIPTFLNTKLFPLNIKQDIQTGIKHRYYLLRTSRRHQHTLLNTIFETISDKFSYFCQL